MEEIVEQHGMCFLEMIGAALMFPVVMKMFAPGGILNNVVIAYMSGLGG